MNKKDAFLADLTELFMQTETSAEVEKLLISILTPEELDQIKKRWQIIKLLLQQKTQREIAEELQISTAMISRGSRELKYGNGIFQILFNKIYGNKKSK